MSKQRAYVMASTTTSEVNNTVIKKKVIQHWQVFLRAPSVGHFRKDVGHLRKDMGHFRKDVGHLRKDMGHFRKDVGHLRKDMGHFVKDMGHLRKDVGHFDYSQMMGEIWQFMLIASWTVMLFFTYTPCVVNRPFLLALLQ
ncbi:hypothetical protein F4703DRAFT_1210278 [Phycomyces blakesleeanus]